jgi:hypothetical protein
VLRQLQHTRARNVLASTLQQPPPQQQALPQPQPQQARQQAETNFEVSSESTTRSQAFSNADRASAMEKVRKVVERVAELCPKCDVVEHLQEGGEQTTLAHVHQHCIEHPDATVAYIHNKGSTHNTQKNTWLRHVHMRAVPACLSQLQRGGNAAQCNVCSARFSPLPHFHTSGNMWVARCSYVKELYEPDRFEGAMERVWAHRPISTEGTNSMEGRRRYSSEHWVHSHPAVTPCDVLPASSAFRWGYKYLPEDDGWEPSFSYAPRFPEEQFYVYRTNKQSIHDIQSHCEGRAGEHTQPEDDLPCDHEWSILYPSKPAQAAWIAPYFKAGVLPSSRSGGQSAARMS